MRRHRLVSSLLVLSLVAVAAGSSDADTDLVANGSFDVNEDGWTADPPATVEWSPLDANASAQSGSALVRNLSAGGAYGISRCIEIRPGGTYDFSARTFAPAGQAGFSVVQLRLWVLPEPGCSGDSLAFYQHEVYSGEWTVSEEPGIVAAQDARSLLMKFLLFKSTPSEVIAHFDEVHLVPEPSSAPLALAALLGVTLLASAARRTG